MYPGVTSQQWCGKDQLQRAMPVQMYISSISTPYFLNFGKLTDGLRHFPCDSFLHTLQ